MFKQTYWRCPECLEVFKLEDADYNGIFVCQICYEKAVKEIESEPLEVLNRFGPNDWGQSTEIVFESEHGDRIYLRLEVVAGSLRVNFGEFDIAIEEIEKFVEFIQKAPTLFNSLIVRDTSNDKSVPVGPLVQAEMDRMLSNAKGLFERDDIFYRALKNK